MADAYTATIYATADTTRVAINAVATGKLTAVVPFMEAGKQKFMVVVAA
jgi:hypothetical protein